eukprot:1463481-Amphidinium_carterae.2
MEDMPKNIPRSRTWCLLPSGYSYLGGARVNAMPPTSTWPDDLQGTGKLSPHIIVCAGATTSKVPYTDYGQIVSAMDRTSQEIIGLDALKEAHTWSSLGAGKESVFIV